MTNEQFAAATRNIRSNASTPSYYELSADEFSFNFSVTRVLFTITEMMTGR